MDPHACAYADRIAESLRTNKYPNPLSAIDAQLIGSRYGVTVPAQPTTVRALSEWIADRILNAPRP